MKIGFISDLHLGFGKEKEIFEDTFLVAEKILRELSEKCDVIFIAGDLFDEKNPNNEVILRAIKIFRDLPKKEEKIKFKIEDKEIEERKPVIFAIHGNHDRKLRDETSIYKIFDELKFFHYIPYGKIIFEDQKVCIYALSNVPERYAKNFLFEKLNPIPLKDFFNILVLHQNIFPYVYSLEESSLSINTLPKNFDLIVDGHIHLRNVERIENTTLLILGSPIITQIREEEINAKRGYHIVEILENKNFKIHFEEIDLPRKYYILEFYSENFDSKILEEKIVQILSKNKEKPVIKIKLFGKQEIEDKIIKNILNRYENRAIIRFDNLVENENLKIDSENINILRERKTLDEIVTSVILENLKERKFSNSFDFMKLIELFEDGDVDSLVDILTKTQKTLASL